PVNRWLVSFLCCFVFFFSSRRRHTRFSRDWSSDVCSSDLLRQIPVIQRDKRRDPCFQQTVHQPAVKVEAGLVHLAPARGENTRRSEERRVGKERRSRWRPSCYRKNNEKLLDRIGR